MLFSHLKIAVRNILKYKIFSFINIGGLAVGLACFILIFLYVRHELSFDGYHSHGDRIYRLLQSSAGDPGRASAVTPAGYATHLPNELPEIEHAVRVFGTTVTMIRGTDVRTLDEFACADPAIFRVFDFPLIQGDPETALEAPGSLVLSEDAAKSLFGGIDPVGKSVTLILDEQRHDFGVTGVMKSIPSNSHMRFDYFIPFATIRSFMGEDALEDYTSANFTTYVMLRRDALRDRVEAKFVDFERKYIGEYAAQNTVLRLQPLKQIHLTTGILFDRAETTSKQTLTIFAVIAVFVLLIACINFMNLSTARSTLRAREVGVRKVAGAVRAQLVRQFFLESILTSLTAVGIALLVLWMFAPQMRFLLGCDVPMNPFSSLWQAAALVFIGLVTGILAGSYPTFVLSAFSPVSVMKGSVHGGVQGGGFRKVLIVLQFGITVFMLIALGTVIRQLNYMKRRDLGFTKEQVVRVRITKNIKDRFDAFRQSLVSHPGVLHVSMVRGYPGYVNMTRGHNWPGAEGDPEENGRSLYTMLVDPYTMETLDLTLVAGRNFSPEIAADVSHGYILNETAVRELGFDDPVGRPFRVWDQEMGQVIGVVQDFHFQSLHREIEPLVLHILPDWCWTVLIRISPDDIPGSLARIETEWRRFEPERPYSCRFLDEMFDWLYRTEQRLGLLFGIFTGLALVVACLGVFGMVAFLADRRKKEIGIRKVLGASVFRIVRMMSRDFCLLVFAAFVISSPLAVLAMNRWLQNFAYRTNLHAGLILLVGVFAQGITLGTISFQSLKASLANPVDSLKYE